MAIGFTLEPMGANSQPEAARYNDNSQATEQLQAKTGFFSKIKELLTSPTRSALTKTNIDDMRITAELTHNKINLKLSRMQSDEKFTFQGAQHYGRDIVNHLQQQINSDQFTREKADIGDESKKPKQNVNAAYLKGMIKNLICKSANIQPTTKPDSTPASYYLIGVTIGAVIGAVIGAAIFGIGSAPGAIIGAGLGGVLGSMFASTFNTPSGPQGPTVDLPQFPIHSQKPNNNDSGEDAILNYNLLNQQQEHYDDMNDYFD